MRLFAVGKGSDFGVTYDQSGAVLDEWGPHNAVSHNENCILLICYFGVYYIEVS